MHFATYQNNFYVNVNKILAILFIIYRKTGNLPPFKIMFVHTYDIEQVCARETKNVNYKISLEPERYYSVT